MKAPIAILVIVNVEVVIVAPNGIAQLAIITLAGNHTEGKP
jgi:hypothetical protein